MLSEGTRTWKPYGIPAALLAAAGAAVLSSAILLVAGRVWLALAWTAILVGCGSLIARSLPRYWVGVFLLTIPFKLGKIFVEPSVVREFVGRHGFPPGALPVANLLLSDLPILVLLVLFGIGMCREGRRPAGHAAHLLAAAAFGWAALSSLNAQLTDAAVWELARQLQYLAVFVLAARYVRARDDLRAILYVIAIAISFQAIYCVGQFFFDLNSLLFGSDATTTSNPELFGSGVMMAGESGVLARMRRGTGTVGHANLTAQYFELWAPFVAAAGFAVRKQALRWAMLGVLALAGVGLVFTFSRGGAVGMAIALAATALALRRGDLLTRARLRALVGLVILAVACLAPWIYEYMTSRPEMFSNRFWLMEVAWNMASSHPLLGVGVNQSMARFNEFDPRRTGTPERLHTYYLSLAAERGFPGALLFMAFYLWTIREAWRSCRHPDAAARMMAAGAFGVLMGVGVHMSFDLFYAPPSQWSIWFVAGMTVALARLQPERRDDALAPGSA